VPTQRKQIHAQGRDLERQVRAAWTASL
jgi:hypothetical protein